MIPQTFNFKMFHMIKKLNTYLPSSSYSWNSSVNRVQVVTAMFPRLLLVKPGAWLPGCPLEDYWFLLKVGPPVSFRPFKDGLWSVFLITTKKVNIYYYTLTWKPSALPACLLSSAVSISSVAVWFLLSALGLSVAWFQEKRQRRASPLPSVGQKAKRRAWAT